MRASSLWLAFALVWAGSAADLSAQTDPETQVRQRFPSLHLSSGARFEPDVAQVGGLPVTGLRGRFEAAQDSGAADSGPVADETRFAILYPDAVDGLLVVELVAQQVVVRALGAGAAAASGGSGMLVYRRAYRSTDVLVMPAGNRSEELLLLQDRDAPRVFDYAIVSTAGVSGVVLDGGAVRFLAAEPPPAPAGRGQFVQPPRTLQIDRPWVVDARGTRSETAARWSIVGAPGAPQLLRLTFDPEDLAYPLVIDPSFSATGALGTPRELHTATLLTSGKVLIVGGASGGVPLATAELYDPLTGTFTPTGALSAARSSHTATLMNDGTVLIVGGRGATTALSSVESYNPVSGLFVAGQNGQLVAARSAHMTTRLADGRLLIAGGLSGSSGPALATAELYDHGTKTFTATGSMPLGHARSAAVLLPNGEVLVAGGTFGFGSYVRNAERYNPATGTFTATGFLPVAQTWHSATVLTNGKVLFAGGDSTNLAVAELYDPATGAFTTTASLPGARWSHSATLLPNDRILIAGGRETSASSWFGPAFKSAQLYDGAAGTFTATSDLVIARYGHTATLLPNGRVLIAGGSGASGLLSSVELYDYATATSAAGPALVADAAGARATLLSDGRVLFAGGPQTVCSLYNPDTNSFSSTGALSTVRRWPRVTLLTSGAVMVSGGLSAGSSSLGTAEQYFEGAWTPLPALMVPRADHASTLLRDGNVLLTGGSSSGVFHASAELFMPLTGTEAATGSMSTQRAMHSATLLANGKVLIAGGYVSYDIDGITVSSIINSAELYDPEAGTFADTGSMTGARYGHTATLLPNGKVLLTGQDVGGSSLNSAELYDPASGTFSTTGSMASRRGEHTATLLPNGKVLITGGYGSADAELYDPVAGTFSSTAGLSAVRFAHAAVLLTTGPSARVLIAGGPNRGATSDIWSLADGATGMRSPVLSSRTASGTLPFTIALGGSGFQSTLEGSNGTANSSAASGPVVQLMRIDNEEITYVRSNAVPAFTTTTWHGTLVGVAQGLHRVLLVANGLPSAQKVVRVMRWAQPDAPVATAQSSTAVTVDWTASSLATSYEILRSTSGTTFSRLATVGPVGQYIDTSVTPGTSYLYSVRVSGPAGGSLRSLPDLATTVIFTDPSLTSGTTVKAAHLTELRTAVSAVALLADVPLPYYSETITPGASVMRAVHVTELQIVLTAALSKMQLAARMWTPAAAGSPVTAARILELRYGVR